MNQDEMFTPAGAFGFGDYPSADEIALQDWAERIFKAASSGARPETEKKGKVTDGADCVYHVRTDRLGIRDTVGGS